jgi:hypothetical protein
MIEAAEGRHSGRVTAGPGHSADRYPEPDPGGQLEESSPEGVMVGRSEIVETTSLVCSTP